MGDQFGWNRQFYSRDGHCMFKVYLGRDAERQLIPAQVERFLALRERLAAAGAPRAEIGAGA